LRPSSPLARAACHAGLFLPAARNRRITDQRQNTKQRAPRSLATPRAGACTHALALQNAGTWSAAKL
jgi:hypothetical protein